MKKTGCYVYAYLRSTASEHGAVGSPYYIGKGKHRRGFYARAFDKRHNIHIPKDKSNVVILADELTDNDARQAEMLLIYFHGRIDLGIGCLRNATDGGEGCEGRIVSSKTRAKISRMHKGKQGVPWTEERRIKASIRYSGEGNPFFGKTHSEETIKKIVEAHKEWSPSAESVARGVATRRTSPKWQEGIRRGAEKRIGRIVSEETRQKISEVNTGRSISSEAKEKMRAAKLGKSQSKQHVANVSKAVTASWATRREKYGPTGRSTKTAVAVQGV